MSERSSPASPDGKKYCALTFDDGPQGVQTKRVLDRLALHGARASFFVLGARLGPACTGLIQEALDLGCSFHNHSWDHKNLCEATEEEIRQSVFRTSLAIEHYTGKAPRFFRAPYLAANALVYETVTLPFVGGIAAMDWPDAKTDAQGRASNVLSAIEDGSIILMHDVQPEPHPTPEALDILLPRLKDLGYEVCSLEELFEVRQVDPKSLRGEQWRVVPPRA